MMSNDEREDFEASAEAGLVGWPEVGSRAMQRLLTDEQWLVVQKDRYRYRTAQDGRLWVRMVIREYLACRVAWH